MAGSNNLSFDTFYKLNKDKSLQEIFNFLNIVPKDSDYFNDSKTQLLYEKFLSINSAPENIPSFPAQYGKIYLGRYNSYNFIIAERFQNNNKNLIIEIELKCQQDAVIEITDKQFTDVPKNMTHKINESTLKRGLLESTFYLIILTGIFSALISVIITFVFFAVSDLITAFRQFLVVFVNMFLFCFSLPFCALILPNLGKKSTIPLIKDKFFKSEQDLIVKSDNNEASKRLISDSFVENYYNLKKVFNENNLTCYFSDNKFCAVIPSDKPIFGIDNENVPFDSILKYKVLYNQINSVYSFISYFQRHYDNRYL